MKKFIIAVLIAICFVFTGIMFINGITKEISAAEYPTTEMTIREALNKLATNSYYNPVLAIDTSNEVVDTGFFTLYGSDGYFSYIHAKLETDATHKTIITLWCDGDTVGMIFLEPGDGLTLPYRCDSMSYDKGHAADSLAYGGAY